MIAGWDFKNPAEHKILATALTATIAELVLVEKPQPKDQNSQSILRVFNSPYKALLKAAKSWKPGTASTLKHPLDQPAPAKYVY
jgi:hypothetical protein